MANIDINFFPGWTRKSVTFTIDDGNVEMDKKFLDIVRPAGILGTFNLCKWDSLAPDEYREFYRGYEIANHCIHHAIAVDGDIETDVSDEPFDRESSDMNYIYKVSEGVYLEHIYKIWGKNTGTYDRPRGWHAVSPTKYYNTFADKTREELEKIFGEGSVRGFAWPHGRGSDGAREHLISEGYQNIRRTGDLKDTTNFDMPADRMNWTYNAHNVTLLEVMKLYEEYPDDGKLKFFSFGVHSVDFERANNWCDLATFAEKYGNRPEEYYYASVGAILDYEDAVKSAIVTETEIVNNSNLPLYAKIDGEKVVVQPKTTYKI